MFALVGMAYVSRCIFDKYICGMIPDRGVICVQYTYTDHIKLLLVPYRQLKQQGCRFWIYVFVDMRNISSKLCTFTYCATLVIQMKSSCLFYYTSLHHINIKYYYGLLTSNLHHCFRITYVILFWVKVKGISNFFAILE